MKYPLKRYLSGIYYSLPLQLLLLHFKKYQVLLLFWLLLMAVVQGTVMHRFGAHILFLYPEYLNETNVISTGLIGIGYGIFVMCWNITTFILHSKNFKFLAATTQPFLKFCINNAAIPFFFLIFYFVKATAFMRTQELLPYIQIVQLLFGFSVGFLLIILLSFFYFFGADKTIYRYLSAESKQALANHKHGGFRRVRIKAFEKPRIDWYISATLKLRQPRKVSHYSPEFLESIFSQHHLAALFSILLTFATLVGVGFLQDNIYFQLPAAVSIMVLFAVAIAVAGAFSLFLRSWAVLFALVVFALLNWLYQANILDPRNKAFGLQYAYSKAAYTEAALIAQNSRDTAAADSLVYIDILNRWRQKQGVAKPVLVLTAVSGGGSRAASFAMNIMQQADSLTGKSYMGHNFLISGASGGMIGAAWYRELYKRSQEGAIATANNPQFVDDISKDLLNPVFSSFVSRDLLAPTQRFSYMGRSYIKDRGYAFEEKLNDNTYGWMNKTLGAYAADEAAARIPVMLLSAVITRDGRRLLLANHSVRFLTKAYAGEASGRITQPDAVDFKSFFAKQQPQDLRFLSALRMNATFPYILPNVWLPTTPVIDVMDAGFRDNTGLESIVRFLDVFKSWIDKNCSRVVVVQIRDKPEGGWQNPYESDNIVDIITKPALLTQNNLFRFQEYTQLAQWEMLEKNYGPKLRRIVFEYTPTRSEDAASLSFHLTRREQYDIQASLKKINNETAMQRIVQYMALDSPRVSATK